MGTFVWVFDYPMIFRGQFLKLTLFIEDGYSQIRSVISNHLLKSGTWTIGLQGKTGRRGPVSKDFSYPAQRSGY